jgi:hypothetical protein
MEIWGRDFPSPTNHLNIPKSEITILPASEGEVYILFPLAARPTLGKQDYGLPRTL